MKFDEKQYQRDIKRQLRKQLRGAKRMLKFLGLEQSVHATDYLDLSMACYFALKEQGIG